MESRTINVKASKAKKVVINVIPGHFATNHSHINTYIDMTSVKCKHSMAEEAARALALKFEYSTPIDSIICMDGCEVIGGFLASEIARCTRGLNKNEEINVISPEYNTNGQMIFRDNLQPMIVNKNVLLLVASATTGKSIQRSLDCIKYYGGNTVGICALFSAINSMEGIEIESLFDKNDFPNYLTYAPKDCPECKMGKRLDAIVNSFGYSKF